MAQSKLKDFLFVLVTVVDQIQGGFHTRLSPATENHSCCSIMKHGIYGSSVSPVYGKAFKSTLTLFTQ